MLVFRFWFNRENLLRIVNLVSPYLNLSETIRGLPVSAEQIVCVALKILAGDQYFRCASYGSGVSKTTAWTVLYR